jgi:hypothetical protein
VGGINSATSSSPLVQAASAPAIICLNARHLSFRSLFFFLPIFNFVNTIQSSLSIANCDENVNLDKVRTKTWVLAIQCLLYVLLKLADGQQGLFIRSAARAIGTFGIIQPGCDETILQLRRQSRLDKVDSHASDLIHHTLQANVVVFPAIKVDTTNRMCLCILPIQWNSPLHSPNKWHTLS